MKFRKILISTLILISGITIYSPAMAKDNPTTPNDGRCWYYSCGTCDNGTVMMCTNVSGCPVNMCSDITLPNKNTQKKSKNNNNQLVALKMYWNSKRGDNVTCGTAQCRKSQQKTGGYRYLRVEGCAFKTHKPGTIPLVLYWSPQRTDNVTVANTRSRAEQVNTGGYRYVRVEGYIYKHKQKGTIPLQLYWFAGRTDNATVGSAKSILSQRKTRGMSFIRTEGYIYPASKCN